MWVAPSNADVFSRAIEFRKPARPCAPAGSSIRRANTHVGARSTFGRLLALIHGTPARSPWRHSLAFSLADVAPVHERLVHRCRAASGLVAVAAVRARPNVGRA
jgi:hypothetical protein